MLIPAAATGTSDSGDCDISAGFLWLSAESIAEGDSVDTWVNAYNDGDSQDVKATFKVNGNTVDQVEKTVDGDSTERFSATISPSEDATVRVLVDTLGEPCGDQEIREDTESLTVFEEPEDGELEVEVTDSDGDPIEDARVEVKDGESALKETDSNGIATFQLAPDTYAVEVSKDGFNTREVTAIIHSGETESIHVELSEENEDAELDVHVEDENGDELEDVRVEVENGGTDTENTNNNGDAFFTLEPDDYDIEISKDGYNTETRSVSLDPGEKRDIKIQLQEENSGGDGGDAQLDVHVEDEDGDELEDARVEVENGDSEVEFTDDNGEAVFFLEPDRYDIEVSKSGYEDETDSVRLSAGERETVRIELEDDRDEDDARLRVLVEDREGNELRNAKVHAANGNRETRFTDRNGEAVFFLEPDDYAVTVSNSGYKDRTKSVNLDNDERETLRFELERDDNGDGDTEGIEITGVRQPSSVCRGGSLNVDVTVANRGGFHETVTITGSGLGSITVGNTFSLPEGQTKTRTLTFPNVQGSSRESFDITVTNHDSDTASRTVNVQNCGTAPSPSPNPSPSPERPSGITMEVNPSSFKVGESTKVSGYVDGTRGRSTVSIEIDGSETARVTTQPDGYYQAFLEPGSVGEHTLTATAGSKSVTRDFTVLPTVHVASVEAPEKVFEGESFEICADVASQVDAQVVLMRDGDRVDSRNGNGNVCFETTAGSKGEKDYKIIASVRGSDDVVTREIDVLESDVEASSFPDKLASVKSGSGMVRVELYNTHEELKRYSVSLQGLENDWISQTEEEVLLEKGERKKVYFYVTPEAEGDFTAELKVRSEGNVIYEQEVEISSGGTTKTGKTWLESLIQLFRL